MNKKFLSFMFIAVMFSVGSASVYGNYETLTSFSTSVQDITGSATMSLPVEVPPGRGGIQPNIQLHYNSSLANGMLGLGWDMSLGAVERSVKNGPPRYDGTDTYLLKQAGSVQELVDVGAGRYAPKVEGAFMNIEFLNDLYWRVTDKSGVRYYFGEEPGSREYDPVNSGHVFQWRLSRVEDVYGNTMTVEYSREGNRLYPDNIQYTGNPPNGVLPFAGIEFIYEPESNGVKNYTAGFERIVTKKMVEIHVKAENEVQRRYSLQYTPSGSTHRSLLTSAVQYGADGTSSLPPIRFTYQEDGGPVYAVSSFDSSVSGDNRWTLRWGLGYDRGGSNYGPVPPGGFDVTWEPPATAASGNNPYITWSVNSNGHLYFFGHKDTAYWMYTYLYVTEPKSLYVPYATQSDPGIWLNNVYSHVGQTWNLRSGWNLVELTTYNQSQDFDFNLNAQLASAVDLMSLNPVAFPSVFSGDFNGDGKTDLARFYQQGGRADVLLSDGGGFLAAQTWITNFASGQELVPGDFNGDGRMDIVAFNKTSGNWTVAFSDGTQFVGQGDWIGGFGSGQKPGSGDFNGDGLTDIVSFFESSGQQFARVALNTGSGFSSWSAKDFLVSASTGTPFAVDFNADGLVDLGLFNKSAGSWSISLNKGDLSLDFDVLPTVDGFGSGRAFFLSDANADRLMDLGYYDDTTGNVHVTPTSGMTFASSYPLPVQFTLREASAGVQAADFNGDGLADFLVADAMGNYEIAYSDGQMTDLLSTVENGVGGVTALSYAPSTDYDNDEMPFVLQTVKTVTVSDGRGNSYMTGYDYAQGRWDAQEKTFCGFGFVRVTDADGNYRETDYHDETVLRGRPKEQRSYASGSQLMNRTTHTWLSQEISPGVDFVYLSRKDNFVYDGPATGRRTAEEFSYAEAPQLGNLTKAVQLGEVDFATGADIGSDRRTGETFYVNNTANGNWLIGLPRETVVKDSDDNTVHKTWFSYDDQANGIAPVKGLLTKKEAWLSDVAGEVNPVTQYAYDPVYGHLLSTTDPMGHVTSIAYDASYHMFPVTTTNALGHRVVNEYYGVDGVPLDSGDGYKGLWGQLKSTTDPNQEIGKRSYDTFGSLVATVSPLDSIQYPTQTKQIEYLPDHIRVTARRRINHGEPPTIDTVQFINGLGRVIQTKILSGISGQCVVSGQKEYNSRGLAEKQYLNYFTPNGLTVIDAVDSGKPHTTITYDALGRVVRTANPDGSYADAIYNGWTTMSIDANGHKQESDFDAYGRLIEKREYLGADGRAASVYPATGGYTLYAATEYAYDSEGNLTRTQDAQGNITTITYDALGRKISMNDPDMGIWQYEYDLNGNLLRQTDAKDQMIDFTYDALNRLVNKTDGGNLNVDYTYDDPFVNNAKGRLTQAQYENDQTDFRYDAIGREIESIKKINGSIFGVKRNYDAINELLDVEYPDGEKVYYKYDPAGQIKSIGTDPVLFEQQSFDSRLKDKNVSLVAGRSCLDSRATSDGPRATNILKTVLSNAADFLLGVKPAYAETVEIFLEAEDMPVKTVGEPIADGWNLTGNGYIEESVLFPADAEYQFEIIAEGIFAAKEWPEMELRVDQNVVDSLAVDSNTWKSFFVQADISAGEHTVAIAFTNDFFHKKKGYRDLHIDKTIIRGDISEPPPEPEPLAVPELTAVASGDAFVDLSWSFVDEAAGYKVYYGTSSGNYGDPVDVGNVAAYTVSELTNGTTYYFVVAAYDATQESGFSNEENATPQAPLLEEDLTEGGEGSAQYYDSPANEEYGKAFDNDAATKYLTFHAAGWLQYQFSGSRHYAVDRYTLASANDYPDRDPKDWTLSGSNDGGNWIIVDQRTDEDFPDRFQTREFSCGNTTAYEYYRIDMINNSGTILQVAEIQLFGEEGPAPVVPGDGLKAEYYNGLGFNTHILTRVDPSVDFNWGTGSPDPLIPSDYFSIRWTGTIRPGYSENHTFYTTSDDGIRLWVNGVLIIDKWIDQAATEWAGAIDLTAGQAYNIRIEYYEKGGHASAKLEWESASQAREVVPSTALYSGYEAGSLAAPVLNDASVGDGQVDLSWNAVATATNYTVKYGTASGNYTVSAPAGDVTNFSVTGLTNGTTYYFVVAAGNAEGDSPDSNEVSAAPQRLVADPQLFVKKVAYNAAGQVTLIEYGNGVVTANTYDPLTLRLTRVYTVDAQAIPLQDLNYAYDPAGNVVSITDAVNSATQSFQYDALNRLVQADGQTYGTKTYAYDEIGNITQKDGRAYYYGENGAGPHAVTSLSDGTVMAYDANGNMVTKQGADLITTGYEYDAENRLIKVTRAGAAVAEYEYDGDGGRTAKTAHDSSNPTGTCFLAGTPVVMADGSLKAIEDIKEGERVMSLDERTVERTDSRVTQTFERELTQDYLVINRKLRVTANHLFYVEGQWREAGSLKVGDKLLARTLEDVAVESIEKIHKDHPVQVYNIEVDQTHNYFVAQGARDEKGVLVHNKFPGETANAVYEGVTKYVGSLFEINGSRSTKYIFLGGARVAAVTNGKVMYYHTDHLGGTNVLTDAAGEVKELIEYAPFGTYARHEKYGLADEVAWFYFTGKPTDDESGLMYYAARYYDPDLGRFITADTIVPHPNNPQAFNRYTYAGNNPVSNLEDGYGFWKKFFGAIVAAVTFAFTGDPGSAAGAYVLASQVQNDIQFASGNISTSQWGANFGLSIANACVGDTTGVNFLVGSAAIGAASAGVTNADVGKGALAGLAGSAAGRMGGNYLAPSAGYVFSNVAAAGVTGQDLWESAMDGFIESSLFATAGLMAPQPTIGQQGTPGAGDLIFYKGGLDIPGLFLTYLQGAPVSHVAIAVNGKQQVDSHVKGGVDIRNINFKRQGRLVKWAGTGNKKFINLTVQYGKARNIKYWLGPNREVCSTLVGRVAGEAGLSVPGFSPSSQHNNMMGRPNTIIYGVR